VATLEQIRRNGDLITVGVMRSALLRTSPLPPAGRVRSSALEAPTPCGAAAVAFVGGGVGSDESVCLLDVALRVDAAARHSDRLAPPDDCDLARTVRATQRASIDSRDRADHARDGPW
jgi:hypothetical protein